VTELSAPMTPPDCDLRDFAFMPLDVVRLRDSDMAATPDAEVFRAGVLSWCVAWHQIPAGSLPDDDAAIARLIGMGRDVKGWKRLRAAGALRGFILCSDGRLYHDVVAEKALRSWEAKKAQRDRTEKARTARLSQYKNHSVTENKKHNSASVVSVTKPSKGEVRESEGKGLDTGEDKSSPAASGENVSRETKPAWWPARDRYGRVTSEITEKIMYDVGKALLGQSAGGQVTRMRKAYRGDIRAVIDLLLQAEEKSTPREWFSAVLRDAELDKFDVRPKHEIFPAETHH
jgi:hypothetical protein